MASNSEYEQQRTWKDQITTLLEYADKEPTGLRKIQIYENIKMLIDSKLEIINEEYRRNFWESQRNKK